MSYVNLAVVRQQLFIRPKVVARLCRDYGLPAPSSPEDLARSLFRAFRQVPVTPSSSAQSPQRIFRAAVFALGSNSRRWSRFIQVEPQIRTKLESYVPRQITAVPDPQRADDIASLLGGQTAKADAAAMIAWAELLTRASTYAKHLEQLRLRITSTGIDSKLVPGVAACMLGFGVSLVSIRVKPPIGLSTWKAPGMGGVLASEFLRNLRWDTYKPDRHIVRLLDFWFPDQMRDAQTQATVIATELFGRSGKVARDFLAGTLLGIAVTPPGTPLIEADNLIWALGAYVEQKGHETAVNYTMQ